MFAWVCSHYQAAEITVSLTANCKAYLRSGVGMGLSREYINYAMSYLVTH